jgi:hypothetical protein
MTDSASPETLPEDRAPGIVLSRTNFTIILVLIASLPIAIGTFLWIAMPANPYPPVEVALELAVPAGGIDPQMGKASPFPLYRITNIGRRELSRVVVYAKDVFGNRFEFNFDESLAPGEERIFSAGDLAMRTAHTLKEGSQLESMEISARLPSGARALSKWTMEGDRPHLIVDDTVRTYVVDDSDEPQNR